VTYLLQCFGLRHHYHEWTLHWKPRYVWIGLYWKRYPKALDLHLCLLPCFAMRFYVQWY